MISALEVEENLGNKQSEKLPLLEERPSNHQSSNIDSNLFTFKPKLNRKSLEIAPNILNFYERQDLHARKQLAHFREALSTNNYGKVFLTNSNNNNNNINNNNEAHFMNNYKSNQKKASTNLSNMNEREEKASFSKPQMSKKLKTTSSLAFNMKSSDNFDKLNTKNEENTSEKHETFKLVANNQSQRILSSSLKLSRSKTMPSLSKKEAANQDRLKMAKEEAERAIRQKKIFSIIGPYPALREALRNRGWVEKFENMNSLPSIRKKSNASKRKNIATDQSLIVDDDGGGGVGDDLGDDNDDNTDENDEEDKIKPWEENNGYFGILSRMLKNVNPSFIFSVKTLDTSYLSKETCVNHFNKNGAFTTKIGLCTNLKNLSWYSEQTADEFYPRCFKLSNEDDRLAFIDDYRLTCCISLLKYILMKHRGEEEGEIDVHITSADELKKMTDEAYRNESIENTESALNLAQTNLNNSQTTVNNTSQKPNLRGSKSRKSISKLVQVPLEAVDFALQRLKDFIDFRQNDDLDNLDSCSTTDDQWDKFYQWFYASCHEKAPIEPLIQSLLKEIADLLDKIKNYWPQYSIDGFRNIWIVKPGALSRGRGIIVFDKIENILELNTSSLQREGKYVVQKYIERPLLIHNTKFDIRQWFLVTDMNPLTIWMYKDCYLRFCTQKFTLETTQQSVHLCNYSIQKYFKNDADRHDELPDENMWSSEEFIDNYLTKINQRNAWDSVIYAGMKNAIISSMLSTQDIVEPRKNTFELYGADFMIGEDLKPWLIEINLSPTMARSTVVTTKLCDNVLEDVCKVVIDRRHNRNCDTGRFEMIYRAPLVAQPTFTGLDLTLNGHAFKSLKSSTAVQQPTPILLTNLNILPVNKSNENIELPSNNNSNSNRRSPSSSVHSHSTRSNNKENLSSALNQQDSNAKLRREHTTALGCTSISISASIQELTHKHLPAQTKITFSNLSAKTKNESNTHEAKQIVKPPKIIHFNSPFNNPNYSTFKTNNNTHINNSSSSSSSTYPIAHTNTNYTSSCSSDLKGNSDNKENSTNSKYFVYDMNNRPTNHIKNLSLYYNNSNCLSVSSFKLPFDDSDAQKAKNCANSFKLLNEQDRSFNSRRLMALNKVQFSDLNDISCSETGFLNKSLLINKLESAANHANNESFLFKARVNTPGLLTCKENKFYYANLDSNQNLDNIENLKLNRVTTKLLLLNLSKKKLRFERLSVENK